MRQAHDQERAARLRNNKRRHRQRQKEYIADLERRLAESHERGICATREVQAAAQRVVRENARLRQILRDQGLDNDAIHSLVYSGAQTDSGSPTQPRQTLRRTSEQQDSVRSANIPDAEGNATRHSNASHPRLTTYEGSSLLTPCDTTSPPKGPPCLPPCKVLSILADNPREDVTQVPAGAHGWSEGGTPDSMGCVQARELLMRFATTEDKLDSIAVALERGCVQDERGTGCRVKNDILWKTLDHVLE